MHFLDFLLHLLCFIFWILKTTYIFSFEYIIPIIGFVLPILSKYLSQLFSFVLRVFFTYVSPCLIRTITAITYIFINVLNGIGVICMAIIESEVNLEYAHAIAMLFILVAIIYFHVTEKIVYLVQECYQMIASYVRFMLNLAKMILIFSKYIYDKLASNIYRRDHNNSRCVVRSEAKVQKNGFNGKHRKIK